MALTNRFDLNDDVMCLYKKIKCSHCIGEYITCSLSKRDSVQESHLEAINIHT